MATFGYTVPQRGALFGLSSMRELLELAAEVDGTGLFDSVWVGDSLTAKPRPESLTLLGALAGMTEQVELGVGCMASFPIRDPAVFAYQWATLDLVSEGRMRLAACTGIVPGGASRAEGSHWGGVPDSERAARLEENIAICRALWTGEAVDYEGTFHSYESLTIEPTPVQDPCPIWIAANPFPGRFWEQGLRRVADIADGWMTVIMAPRSLDTAWTDVQKFLAEAGRSAEGFPVMAYHNINIGPDRDECLAETKRFLDAYYGPVFTEDMAACWTAAGTPEQCIEHLTDVAAQGATRITLRATSWDQRGQLDRLVNEVLPEL